ncbi:methanethiol S-methyltransferase [Altererythrobacter litoralis]|uniref:methanethiol S-methyltransferase n=1 Tax=Altererythrobacter litoralis TaxID=3113904 RepID=A0ABU7GE68_9SPHN|nr:isoprenylcysteine carboxylmethyltransferase family protein [Erythrobacteraceae bacterium 1XM1-14]
MGRLVIMALALVCYAAFFASFVYLVGWVGGFEFMPTHVDNGLSAAPATAALINIGLIALFGIQHSVMARPGFKAAWTKMIPAAAERSIYCLVTALVLVVLFRFWHPIEGTIWSVQNETARMAIWAMFWLGWGILFISTWLLNHFELFGLQQAWLNLTGKQEAPPKMRTPLFYKFVRHPLYTGFFIAFWAAPDMSYSHLLAAVGFTIYIMIGISYEERDLLAVFGQQYADYRKRVGAFIPGIGKAG